MKILVALDGSSNSEAVFDVAVRQVASKKTDSIYLLCVTESTPLSTFPVSGFLSAPFFGSSSESKEKKPSSSQDDLEQYDPKGEFVNVLTRFALKCERLGIVHHAILGVAEHVGTLICQAVLEKGIDLLVVGRRRAGTFERLFAGSTSKYCMENAGCNVLVVKDEEPREVHSDISEVVEATERERQRRMREEEIVEVHSDLDKVRSLEEEERARRIKEMREATPSQFERDLSSNITRMAEEEERQRRINEERALDKREQLEREAAVRAAILAEEKEQQRRIEEEKDLEKRAEMQRILNQKMADRLADEERQRRLIEEMPVFIDRKLQVELLSAKSA